MLPDRMQEQLDALSEWVCEQVQSEPHQGRQEFLAKLKEKFPSLMFQVMFLEVLPHDPLFHNFHQVLVFMCIDYRRAGEYTVHELDMPEALLNKDDQDET